MCLSCLRPHHRLALLLAMVLAVGACANVKPKEVSTKQDCRDCPPGIFSGEDGVITVY